MYVTEELACILGGGVYCRKVGSLWLGMKKNWCYVSAEIYSGRYSNEILWPVSLLASWWIWRTGVYIRTVCVYFIGRRFMVRGFLAYHKGMQIYSNAFLSGETYD